MKKRLCTTCKKRQPRNKSSSYCKECHNEYQKKYYKKNPQSINESSIRRRQILVKMKNEAKDVPCQDCGKRYPSYVMDFDHRSDKKFNLSAIGSKFISIKKVQEEIDKCDIVCANCHRERTHGIKIAG